MNFMPVGFVKPLKNMNVSMITLNLVRWQADRIEQALAAQMRMCDAVISKSREVEIRRAEYEAVREIVMEAILNE